MGCAIVDLIAMRIKPNGVDVAISVVDGALAPGEFCGCRNSDAYIFQYNVGQIGFSLAYSKLAVLPVR